VSLPVTAFYPTHYHSLCHPARRRFLKPWMHGYDGSFKKRAFKITSKILSKSLGTGVQMGKTNSWPSAGHYDANYGNFQTELYAQIRQEAFGEDIGQNSWLTSNEQDSFLQWLNLSPGKTLLDVACGAGGPALRIAAATGCSVVGIDVHEPAITTARSLAVQRGLAERAEFQAGDADRPLPFSHASFDAITCIDAINHFSDRPRVLAEWARLLKRGGRLLFTDPITLTGPLTNAEAAVRSTAGFYLFVPHGYDESVLAQCGLRLLACEDITANLARIAQARHSARASRSAALREIEGDQAYQGQQDFLAVAARVAREGRLSRFVYVSEKLS
jgi:cyclopropane fatty-acyl-phospholipid synthase-like methyltransferase